MRALVEHCRSQHLVPHLTQPLVADRSAKLRTYCATYLLQVQIHRCIAMKSCELRTYLQQRSIRSIKSRPLLSRELRVPNCSY